MLVKDTPFHMSLLLKCLLTRHSMAIEVGSDGFLQLVIRRRLLKPQAEVVLQVLVELVTWKQQANKSSEQTLASQKQLVPSLFTCCLLTKSKFMKGHDISIVEIPLGTRRAQVRPHLPSLYDKDRHPPLNELIRNTHTHTHIMMRTTFIISRLLGNPGP